MAFPPTFRNEQRLPLPEDLAQTTNFKDFFNVETEESTHGTLFNFTDEAQLSTLLTNLDIYEELLSQNSPLVLTFLFFFELAHNLNYIDEIPYYVINQKLSGKDNTTITKEVNELFNKSYHINYISTIFHKRGLSKVAEVAQDWLDSASALANYNVNSFK